jgi:hypothetical protein
MLQATSICRTVGVSASSFKARRMQEGKAGKADKQTSRQASKEGVEALG